MYLRELQCSSLTFLFLEAGSESPSTPAPPTEERTPAPSAGLPTSEPTPTGTAVPTGVNDTPPPTPSPTTPAPVQTPITAAPVQAPITAAPVQTPITAAPVAGSLAPTATVTSIAPSLAPTGGGTPGASSSAPSIGDEFTRVRLTDYYLVYVVELLEEALPDDQLALLVTNTQDFYATLFEKFYEGTDTAFVGVEITPKEALFGDALPPAESFVDPAAAWNYYIHFDTVVLYEKGSPGISDVPTHFDVMSATESDYVE